MDPYKDDNRIVAEGFLKQHDLAPLGDRLHPVDKSDVEFAELVKAIGQADQWNRGRAETT